MEDVREKVKQLKKDINDAPATATHSELVSLFERLITITKQVSIIGKDSSYVLN